MYLSIISILKSQMLMDFVPFLHNCGQFLGFMDLRVYRCTVRSRLSISSLKDFRTDQGKFMVLYDDDISFPIIKNSYTFAGLNMKLKVHNVAKDSQLMREFLLRKTTAGRNHLVPMHLKNNESL